MLAAGPGAGDLAPELLFLPVLTKNRHGKDTACSIRQWGGGCLCRLPHFSARTTQPPGFPTYAPASTALLCCGHHWPRIQDGVGDRVRCFPQSLSERSHRSLASGRSRAGLQSRGVEDLTSGLSFLFSQALRQAGVGLSGLGSFHTFRSWNNAQRPRQLSQRSVGVG